jgi:hypothetical protein
MAACRTAQHPNQPIRIVGEKAVDAKVDERPHLILLVDGPDVHLKPDLPTRFAEATRCQVMLSEPLRKHQDIARKRR